MEIVLLLPETLLVRLSARLGIIALHGGRSLGGRGLQRSWFCRRGGFR